MIPSDITHALDAVNRFRDMLGCRPVTLVGNERGWDYIAVGCGISKEYTGRFGEPEDCVRELLAQTRAALESAHENAVKRADELEKALAECREMRRF